MLIKQKLAESILFGSIGFVGLNQYMLILKGSSFVYIRKILDNQTAPVGHILI